MGRNLKDFYEPSSPNSSWRIQSTNKQDDHHLESQNSRKTHLMADGDDDSILGVSRRVSRNRDVKKHATRMQKVANGEAKPLRTDGVWKKKQQPDWKRQWGEG